MKLVRVAICRHAATPPAQEQADIRTRKMTSKLRERIDERGIGLFASQADREHFLGSLPDVERQRWIKIVTERHLVHVLDPGQADAIHKHDRLEELKRDYADIADVVVCGSEQARDLGLDNDQENATPPAVTPVRDLDLINAFGYDEARPQNTRTVESKSRRQTVWDEWIAPLAPRVSHLIIVDRYALKNETKASRAGSGFKWLLQQTIAARTVTFPLKLEIVIENDKGGVSVGDLSRTIESFGLRDPNPGFFRSVSIWLATKEFGQRHLHDRMLRFDGRVLDCGTGLQIFSQEDVYQSTKIACGSFRESELFMAKVERECIGARWRDQARMWLDSHGTDQIRLDEADERP